MNTCPPHHILHHFSYDPETGFFTRIRAVRTCDPIGVRADRIAKEGYYRVQYRCRSYQAHRLAWFFVHGEWPTQTIDHINGVRSDNRIHNLRLATIRQNACNRRSRGPLAKGVSLLPSGSFQAEITFAGRRHYLGCFKTETEASQAYTSAALRLFGDFAFSQAAGHEGRTR